ncbi:MAG: putative lipid II flippase FtsW [Acidobacteriaceae bacterium]
MAKRIGIDKWLFAVTLLLVVLGLLMVFSASAIVAHDRFGSAYYFFVRQSIWTGIGLGLLFGLSRVDYAFWKKPWVVFGTVGITTGLLSAVLLLDKTKGSHRWVHFGSLASLQPSELAKPVLVLFLAYFLESRLRHLDDTKRTLLPLVLVTGLLCGLILIEPDLGTTLVCAGAAAVVLYVAGLRWRYYAMAAIAILPVLTYLLLGVGFRQKRVSVFLDPDADPQGAGFHITQSLIAVGTGGLLGRGLMEGRQKLFYLPEAHTDFIFANLAEELGLAGAMLVVTCFAVLAFRGLRVAFRTEDHHARLLALGLTSTIIIQALFNLRVVIALLPTTGIPLPVVSYGGTSIAVTLAMVGILLNISKQTD